MAQLTIYLDDETQRKAKKAAVREGKSLSRWARENLSRAADEGRTWPKGYFALFGSIDDSSFEIPQELPLEGDAPRTAL
jgi:hypothetical protein